MNSQRAFGQAPAGSLLLVDDEEKILKTLSRALRSAGYDVTDTGDPRHALRLLVSRAFDVLVLDNVMPVMNGLDMIRELSVLTSEIERPQVVIMTAHASLETAIDAMRLGAFDYLQKPFEIDEMLFVTRRAVEHHRLRTKYRYLLNERDEQFDHYGIVGKSQAIRDAVNRAKLVANTQSTVLITGESGTGKELLARMIHDRSAQRDLPLVKVSCGAVPEAALDIELFGQPGGPGGVAVKKGKFSLANGGTIFLDDVATIGPSTQARLLRVLQDGEFEPIGGDHAEKVAVRVIASSHRDLRMLLKEGTFREDLLYGLDVVRIDLPPLRERREDISLLVDHFVRKHAQRIGRPIEGVDPTVRGRLEEYDWPGNVRELENAIERAVVLSNGPLITGSAITMLGAIGPHPDTLPSARLRQNIQWAERETIRRALETAGGLKKDAAELMGISQRALSYYLRKYRFD